MTALQQLKITKNLLFYIYQLNDCFVSSSLFCCKFHNISCSEWVHIIVNVWFVDCGIQIAADMNDAQVIMKKFCGCQTDYDVMRLFSSIHGPWAFVLWQVCSHVFTNC